MGGILILLSVVVTTLFSIEEYPEMAPVLFLTGSQCLSGASALLRRALGDSRTPLPHGSGCWWGRLAAYGLALCLGAGLEWAAAPLLLKAAAQFV